LIPLVLEGKGSDEDVLAVATAVEVFKPEIDDKSLAKLINTLASRGLYDRIRRILKAYDAKSVAKAMIVKALSSERPENISNIIDELRAVDELVLKESNAPALLRASRDKEILEIARKSITPKNLETRLWVIRETFYNTSDEEAIRFLIGLLKRRRDYAHLILDALVDVRPEPDRDYITHELGEEDRKRLVYAGGRSKKILEKIEDALVEGLLLGRIGQLLHDHPELLPVGEYILEKRLRLKVPEDERRGTFIRALHFFPSIRGFGDKILYLLADAIKYAIVNEDTHLLRIAVSQLADIKVHPDLKAKVIEEAIKGIEETDRFFDAMDTILRHLIFDERLAAKVIGILAGVLPDIRAILAVFGDALRRLLSSPAAYEVLEALIEAKPGDKALKEVIDMVTDERARIRATVKLGEGIESLDPYKVLLYAYDLLDPREVLKLLQEVEFDEALIPAIKKALEALSREDLERFLEKLESIDARKIGRIYVILAAKFGREDLLDKLLELEDVEMDSDTAETLVMLAARRPKAEEVLKKFLHKDPIVSALARMLYGSPKALEYARELASRGYKEKALGLLLSAFRGSNNIEAAEMILRISDEPLKYLIEVAPDIIYAEPLFKKVREIVNGFFKGSTGFPEG